MTEREQLALKDKAWLRLAMAFVLPLFLWTATVPLTTLIGDRSAFGGAIAGFIVLVMPLLIGFRWLMTTPFQRHPVITALLYFSIMTGFAFYYGLFLVGYFFGDSW